MPTCPNCGSIVMEGDPYCSHCGAHFKWSYLDDDEAPDYGSSSQFAYDPPASYEIHAPDTAFQKPEVFLDFGEVSETYADVDEETIDHIAGGVCATSSQELQLKAKIRENQKAQDFRGFYIKKDYEFEVYYFHFIQQNRYVKTTHVATYIQDPDYYRPYRTFHEQYAQHSHEGLTSDLRFKKMVEATGLELDGCEGGYESRLKDEYGDVELTGEIEIRVRFKADGKIRVYDLDLEEMRLLPDYYEYCREEYS